MKKSFYAYLLMAFTVVLASCSNDDEVPVHPMSGVYSMSSYETADEPKPNYPVSSPIYAEISGDPFFNAVSGLFRMMGGAMLPQVLNTITLENDGNVCASYIENPQLKTDQLMAWSMSAFMGGGFPKATEIQALAATGGFVDSAKGLATWTEQGGVLTLKLNIANIIADAMKGTDGNVKDMQDVVNLILTMKPAELKSLLSGILGEPITQLSDASILQLQSWALNGIPMKAEVNGAETKVFLQKKDFENLFASRKGKGFDGSEQEFCDVTLLFGALVQAGIVPQDAAAAIIMLDAFRQNWKNVELMNVGFSLVKQ